MLCYVAGVYTEGVDLMGHRYGPTSAEANASLHAIDKVMYNIGRWLEHTNRWVSLVSILLKSFQDFFSNHTKTNTGQKLNGSHLYQLCIR